MLQSKFADKIKAHILCWITFFENPSIYEIMWKNTVGPDRPQTTIWHMRISCCIIKATDTLRICNAYYSSTATIVSRMHLNVTFIHTVPLLFNYILIKRVRGSAVGWGAALQVGRSLVRFPMVSLEFFIDIILPAAIWPRDWLSL
jgi:hypothetical protein